MLAVNIQTLFHGFFFVVFTLNQWLTGEVVFALGFWRVESDMVNAARCRMRTATTHALNDGLEGHINFKHIVQLDPRGLHGIGLGKGAWEAIKQKTIGAIGLGNALFHEINDEVIADQTT